MRIVPILAAGLVLGTIGATAASAAPALPQPGVIAGNPAQTVDWHPSTSHWDHHFHAHQESLRYHQPTEAEHRIRRMRRTEPHMRDPAWAAPRYRLGNR
ncbi:MULTISPECIES: hypothetical protein [Methylorubrum]|uniref:hypothetical protein n=1 Tax=Methylorubrum TaxID=2282523 RepID=UPI0020A1F98E|nr:MULTISPECIES: hypothetical protein [Methylorubrum]MCP1547500.1 hypothetical protein [Methylorubrum zatmanii]MCP1555884.1 hypothetical protein [Methylorubrum extorquens]MCP1577803.1 hypothetical protein [Methylorubrum extorquens]